MGPNFTDAAPPQALLDVRAKQILRPGTGNAVLGQFNVAAHDVAKHEKNRGLPDVCRKIQRANGLFHELGIQTTASVTASKLIEDYEKLPAFLAELGFTSCTFSYPLTNLASSYLSFSDSSLVRYPTEELIQVFEKIKHRFFVVGRAGELERLLRESDLEIERFVA